MMWIKGGAAEWDTLQRVEGCVGEYCYPEEAPLTFAAV